jgi:hypothetical protein
MNVSAHTTRRLVSVTGLAAVIAALAVPTALARPTIDGGDSAYRMQVAVDLRSPDTLDTTTQALALAVDPAIAAAMAVHQRLNVVGDLRSPDTLDATVNPIAQNSAVAAPATPNGTNWGLVAAMFAAIAILFVGVGALGLQGHGKRHGSMKPA